jgi:hypothetical protein
MLKCKVVALKNSKNALHKMLLFARTAVFHMYDRFRTKVRWRFMYTLKTDTVAGQKCPPEVAG